MCAQQLDYSFRGITYVSDIKQTRPRNGLKPYKRSPTGRFWCSSFRLNNNNIVTVQGIKDLVHQIFEIPENLTWIDLSFNKLTYIHPEIGELRNLKILYLHGNLFTQFTSVLYHLQALDKLYSLTLHGNPIEEVRGYRQKVLFLLPNLKSLDFTNVTNADIESVEQANGGI
ncbi:hypothetical protein RUM43_012142 [Polyplax serrata]|uniref:Leucine-rich repeat-containing protein 51 n=1 Tax=Polyplax serrata TaxID=468196 RepID=A0AAN8RZQ5_POLSC